MRTNFILIILLSLLVSCSQNSGKGISAKKSLNQTLSLATDYAKGQLKESERSVDKDGKITISGGGKSYLIDPQRIVFGELDEDENKDAIVPLELFNGEFYIMTEYLVLLKTKNGFVIAKTLDNIIKILRIENRTIFAETSKVAPDSPTFGCEKCIEIVKYQYKDGDFVRTE